MYKKTSLCNIHKETITKNIKLKFISGQSYVFWLRRVLQPRVHRPVTEKIAHISAKINFGTVSQSCQFSVLIQRASQFHRLAFWPGEGKGLRESREFDFHWIPKSTQASSNSGITCRRGNMSLIVFFCFFGLGWFGNSSRVIIPQSFLQTTTEKKRNIRTVQWSSTHMTHYAINYIVAPEYVLTRNIVQCPMSRSSIVALQHLNQSFLIIKKSLNKETVS